MPDSDASPDGVAAVVARTRGDSGAPAVSSERAVADRLQKLRVILPAMAQEIAAARREIARLRGENARLARRVAELEACEDAAKIAASRREVGASS